MSEPTDPPEEARHWPVFVPEFNSTGGGHAPARWICACSMVEHPWPCPILAEAAKVLRGESE